MMKNALWLFVNSKNHWHSLLYVLVLVILYVTICTSCLGKFIRKLPNCGGVFPTYFRQFPHYFVDKFFVFFHQKNLLFKLYKLKSFYDKSYKKYNKSCLIADPWLTHKLISNALQVDISKYVTLNMATAHYHRDNDGTLHNIGTFFNGRPKTSIYKVPPPSGQ